MSWTIEKASRIVGRTLRVTVEHLPYSNTGTSFLPWRWDAAALDNSFTDAGFSRSLPAAQKAALKVAEAHLAHLRGGSR